MFNNRRNIEKWQKGPPGFADKANRQIDAISQRLPGVRVPRALLGKHPIPPRDEWFYAKITASSSSSADHSIAEVDALGEVITDGGREATDAKAMNERKGVPVDTYVIVFDLGPTTTGGDPVYKFIITDGLTDNPKDLTKTTIGVNTTTWNVEDDSSAVDYDMARTKVVADAVYFYDRMASLDASGFVIDLPQERGAFIAGDSADAPKSNHITMVDRTISDVNGKTIKLNQPQSTDTTTTVNLISSDSSILISGGPATWNFDDSGRNNDPTNTFTFDLSVYGNGADGQGYEDVEVNGVSILAKIDDGIINFQDRSSPTAGRAAVQFSGSAADPRVTIEGEVDIDAYLKALPGYNGANVQVLRNNAGTIGWVDTAECP